MLVWEKLNCYVILHISSFKAKRRGAESVLLKVKLQNIKKLYQNSISLAYIQLKTWRNWPKRNYRAQYLHCRIFRWCSVAIYHSSVSEELMADLLCTILRAHVFHCFSKKASLSPSLLSKVCLLLFMQPYWPFPASHAYELFIWLQPKPQDAETAIIKTKHHHCQFLFCFSVQLYAMISDHANICIYAHWSSTTGYGFLLNATTNILCSYFQKNPILKSKSKWAIL